MPDSPPTLRNLLLGNVTDTWKSIEQSEAGRSLKETAVRRLAVPWGTVSREVEERLGEALQIDPVKIFLGGWMKYRQFKELLERSQQSPDQTLLLSLADHSIQSTHRPLVELLIDGAVVGRLEFEVQVAFRLEGVVLKVRAGRVREVVTARGHLTGAVKCHGVALAEAKSRPFELPGGIQLSEDSSSGVT